MSETARAIDRGLVASIRERHERRRQYGRYGDMPGDDADFILETLAAETKRADDAERERDRLAAIVRKLPWEGDGFCD